MNDRSHDDLVDDLDDDFLALSDVDYELDPLAASLPDLSAEQCAPPPDLEHQDEIVEGLGYGGIPAFVTPWREAIATAIQKVVTGATTAVGYCLQNTRLYYNVPPLYSCAKLSLAGAQALGKAYEVGFDETHKIPRGAIVYFIGPRSQYGHVGPSIGGGFMVSTDWPAGRYGKVGIADIARAWGYTQIFWSPFVNDVRVWAPHRWIELTLGHVPGVWEFVTDQAAGRELPNRYARIAVERDAGEKGFPERAIKHEGDVWFRLRDGHWYLRADLKYLGPIAKTTTPKKG